MLTKTMVARYIKALEGKEGCNFRERIKGKLETIHWKCSGRSDYPLSKKILKRLGATASEIQKVLQAAQRHGGYCDCEIIFNARAALLKKKW